MIRPMHDYVMVRRLPDKQIGRIIVPDTVDTKPRIGIVEAVGPGVRLKDGSRQPMLVTVGDRVVFSLDSGHVVQLPGQGPNDTRLLVRQGGLVRENGSREGGIVAILDGEGDASALGSPWPGYVTDGPQDTSPTERANG